MKLPLDYPLTLSFKIIALAPQISIRDANESLVAYVKQKLFKLKEAVTVFADESQTQPLFTLNADRVIDFSARYEIRNDSGIPIGSVKRQGMRSLWRAHYDVFDANGTDVMTIREENPWVKVLDGLFSSIPFVGILSGYVFHPAYLVTREDGTLVLRMQKQPAFFEGKFELTAEEAMTEKEEPLVLLSLIMMLLLERARG